MNKTRQYLDIGIRTTLLIFIPILFVMSVIYEGIFGSSIRFDWFTVLMTLIVFLQIMIRRYQTQVLYRDMSSLKQMEHKLLDNNWEVTERRRSGWSVKATFDRPFSYIFKDTIDIQYLNQRVRIEGPNRYVEALGKELLGGDDSNKESLKTKLTVFISAFIVLMPFVSESGIIWQMKVLIHNVQASEATPMALLNETRGNSVENSNNGGYGVTDDEYLYLIEYQDSLAKINTATDEKEFILEYNSDDWLGNINLVNDWLYYTKNESLNRIRTDGTEEQIIYNLGFLSDIHIVNEWIYFINGDDNSTIYRMNLEGGELERLLDVQTEDLAVYDDFLLVSYYTDNYNNRLDRVELDGSNRETIFEGYANQMVYWDDYFYYIGEDLTLYRTKAEGDSDHEQLINQVVRTYTLTDEGIVFVLASFSDYHESNGIYLSELDGTDRHLIDDTKYADRLIKVNDDVLYNTMQGSDYERMGRVDFPM